MKNLRLYLLSFLLPLAISIPFNYAFAAEAEPVVIGVGQTWALKLPPSQTLHLSSGHSIVAEDIPTGVRIFGKSEGTTTLRSGRKVIQINVLSAPNLKAWHKLTTLLKKLRGLRADPAPGVITIRGHMYRFSDWLDIAHESNSEKFPYKMKVSLDPDVHQAATEFFQQKLQPFWTPNWELKVTPEAQVSLPKSELDQLGAKIDWLQKFGFNIQELEPKAYHVTPVVRVRAQIAEVSKKFSRHLGISWPGSATAQILPNKAFSGSLDVTLQMLEENGHGRILAQPVLSCRSGGQAEFHSGGEFPIKIMGFKKRDVLWKRHGVILEVKPVVSKSGFLKLSILAEISLVDQGQAVEGVPGLKTNRVHTEVDVKDGQTIALSGLIQTLSSKDRSGLPFLNQIPILGNLFSSQNFVTRKSELIVFLTPKVIETKADYKSFDWSELPNGPQFEKFKKPL